MYGMVYSLNSLVSRLSPTSAKDSFLGYATDKYKLHLYESPTGTKFILNTDHKAGNLQEVLRYIYAKIYVEYVIKNPCYKIGEPIDIELFTKGLDNYIQSKAFYNNK